MAPRHAGDVYPQPQVLFFTHLRFSMHFYKTGLANALMCSYLCFKHLPEGRGSHEVSGWSSVQREAKRQRSAPFLSHAQLFELGEVRFLLEEERTHLSCWVSLQTYPFPWPRAGSEVHLRTAELESSLCNQGMAGEEK